MSPSLLTGIVALAVLKGTLVALPDAGAFRGLARVSSPVWVAVLPGMILVGTFGVLAMPEMASALVVLAALVMPLLAGVAVLAVVRLPRGARPVLIAMLAVAAVFALPASGWAADVARSLVTALAGLSLGIAIVRVIPARWLPVGVLAMCAVDVVLLALGIGQSAIAAMAHAAADHGRPPFDHAAIGTASTDFPDLVLASVLGGVLAGEPDQRRGAVLLATLAGLYGLLLAVADVLPATVPIALTYLLVHVRIRKMRIHEPGGQRWMRRLHVVSRTTATAAS